MAMQPQPGIFAFGTIDHCYVEFDLTPNRDPGELASALAALHGPDTPLVATSAVVGLRPELWAAVAPDTAPPGVRSFARIEAGDYSMPATQHDAWIWLAGANRDTVFDSALAAIRSLDGQALVATEVTGFGYQRNRDLTGLSRDRNPSAVEAPAVAVGQEGPGAGAGAGVVLRPAMGPPDQFRHPINQGTGGGHRAYQGQEHRTGGRRHASRLSRNVVKEDGEELAIYRRNTAWGGPTCHGTMFVGFCRSQHPLQIMLERMAGVADGTRDALTRYSLPLTGAYYVVPALDALARLLPPEA
jgi:putative iron-dependent peroxidase